MGCTHATSKREQGLTLNELAIGLAIASLLMAIALPAMSRIATQQRGRETTHLLSGAFELARSEAIRSGNIHIVFLQTDAAGNPLLDENGDPTSVVVLDDGAPGSANQNCRIDAGEIVASLQLPPDVVLGQDAAAGKAPNDLGAGALVGASSFSDPAVNPAQWVLFRPEGLPLAFDAACNTGPTGSGAGAFYLNAGGRDFAALLLPLGGTRVGAWNADAGAWSN
ncbi:MAG: pilus assembly FimT family protein [Myxococcota bacterium]